jgi:hypothetical protein
MAEFEAGTNDAEAEASQEQCPMSDRLGQAFKVAARRFVMFLSFGPGILGVLWLLGRILKR